LRDSELLAGAVEVAIHGHAAYIGSGEADPLGEANARRPSFEGTGFAEHAERQKSI
jgi:hypothetical protein